MKHKKQFLHLNLDISSLAIGFLLAICLLLVIGASNNNNNSQRYQCCSAGDEQLAVFVIDTATGHIWRLSRSDIYDFGTPSEPKSVRRSIRPMVD